MVLTSAAVFLVAVVMTIVASVALLRSLNTVAVVTHELRA